MDGLAFAKVVKELLHNDLIFHPHLVTGDHTGVYEGHFFCNTLTDDDLPWDKDILHW